MHVEPRHALALRACAKNLAFFIADPLIYFLSMNIPENLFSLTALLNAFVSFIALRCNLSWDPAANLSKLPVEI